MNREAHDRISQPVGCNSSKMLQLYNCGGIFCLGLEFGLATCQSACPFPLQWLPIIPSNKEGTMKKKVLILKVMGLVLISTLAAAPGPCHKIVFISC